MAIAAPRWRRCALDPLSLAPARRPLRLWRPTGYARPLLRRSRAAGGVLDAIGEMWCSRRWNALRRARSFA
jgi:hypothetical protein